jgi:hypothetical protein
MMTIRNKWNESNNIQQTSKLFIPQKRNSVSLYRDAQSGNIIVQRSNWNENNRQQGIVNLSVIDKVDINNNRDDDNNNLIQSDEDININNNNLGINFNDKNILSSRPVIKSHNDYDSDELENDKMNKEDIKEEEKESKKGNSNTNINQFQERKDSKGSKISKDSKKSNASKNSGKNNEKNIININLNKQSPKDKEILNYQYGNNKNIDLFNKSNKISNSNINIINKPEQKKNLVINYKEKKIPQKSSGLTYVINSKGKQGDTNIKKSQQAFSINYPKNEDVKQKFFAQSQNIEPAATGKMKKKSKVKSFEYLREPNQSQNFQ